VKLLHALLSDLERLLAAAAAELLSKMPPLVEKRVRQIWGKEKRSA